MTLAEIQECADARDLMHRLGYDCVRALAVRGHWIVWQDTAGNIRTKDTRRPFEGLLGAFYDNHNGNGETALEAALAAIAKVTGGDMP